MLFFPIGDVNTQRRTSPFVNYTLIAINVAVYMYQVANPEFTLGYSVVPAEITQGRDIQGQVLHEGRRSTDLRTAESDILGDLDAYTLFDLTAGFGRGNWDVDFYVKNVFDERAELSRFTQCAEAVCGAQAYTVVAPPRTYGIKFSQDF